MSKISISNIAWSGDLDTRIYQVMKEYGLSGLEIAPTRVFQKEPYDKLIEAGAWAGKLKKQYGFIIPSMQSIWFGRQERLFGTEEERRELVNYTKKAIDFAMVIKCDNLVFGCPVNRTIPDGADPAVGIQFFKEVGDYAYAKGTVIGIEANPPIYNTNYINDTTAAFDLIEQVDSKGFRLNFDFGTLLWNEESIDELRGRVSYINHVHISEPGLRPIKKRGLHGKLKELLDAEGYSGFVSIEMSQNSDTSIIEDVLKYVREVFG